MNYKHFKRKFLAGLCALSSVGPIVKPAIDSSTYAASIDVEAIIVAKAETLSKQALTELILKFKSEPGHKYIGSPYKGAVSSNAVLHGAEYPPDKSDQTQNDLIKYITEKFGEEFGKQVDKETDAVIPLQVKNSQTMKDITNNLINGQLFQVQAMGNNIEFLVKEHAKEVVEQLWKQECTVYENPNAETYISHAIECSRMPEKLRSTLSGMLLGYMHMLYQNWPLIAGCGLFGLSATAFVLAIATFLPSFMKFTAKGWVNERMRQSAQKKETKTNMSKGSNNVLRLDKLTPDKLNEIILRFEALVAKYDYAPEAVYVANQILSDLIDKKADISKPVGMLLVYGPPGSGKSSIVRSFLKIIYDVLTSGRKPLVISQSMIDEKDHENSEAKQAWGVLSKDVAGQKISSLSPFAAAVLSADKYKDGLVYVLVDDADKFKEEVLRGLWDVTDGGTIHVAGKEISLSKIVFILTANSDMSGAMDSLGGKAAKSASSAFTSRCLKFLINAPKAQHYKVKIIEMLNDIAATNGSFNISDNTIDVLARRCVKVEKGMRAVNEIKRRVLSILRSPNYNPHIEIVPVDEERNGWLEQRIY